MGDLLKKLTGSKWGVAGIFAGLAGVVAAGVVPHDDAQIQGLATAGAAVLGGAIAVGAKLLIAKLTAKGDEAPKA